MKNTLQSFLTAAKGIRMTPEEKKAVHKKMKFAVRKGLDTRLKHRMGENLFLSSARNISLSGDEREDLKKQLFKAMGRKLWTATSPHSLDSLTRSARAVGLSKAEHVGLKEGLFEAMKKAKQPLWNPFRAFGSVLASVLIVTFAGGGVSYASENALPGELLYPLKVHVNEAFLARFAVSSEEKARFDVFQAERRLQEAEHLAGISNLGQKEQELIDRYFDEHITDLHAQIESLLASGNTEAAGKIALDLEATLQAHVHVMESLRADRETAVRLQPLIENARRARIEAEKIVTLSGTDEEALLKFAGEAVTEAIQSAEKAIDLSGANASQATVHLNKAKKATEEDISAGEKLRRTRSALRKAKESSLLLQVPGTIGIEADDDDADIQFTTSVRLQMTEESLRDIEQNAQDNASAQAEIDGAKELLDIANTEIENGNVGGALEASAEALKKAEAAKALLPK